MKTCSKCGVEKEDGEFNKSPRYLSGLVSHCKECQRKAREKRLAANPLCIKCRTVPHMPNTPYCDNCLRELSGLPPAKFKRDKTNKTLCSRCRVNPRLPYHRYCQECKNESTVKWSKEKGGWRNMTPEQRQMAVARKYTHTLLLAGKIQRGPCVFCGKPGVQFHHFDYLRMTRNFVDVCKTCHCDAHRLLNILLTICILSRRAFLVSDTQNALATDQ